MSEEQRLKSVERATKWNKENAERRRQINRESAKRLRDADPEKFKKRRRDRYAANPEPEKARGRIYSTDYYAANKDRIAAITKEYRSRPEVKQLRNKRLATPENKEKIRIRGAANYRKQYLEHMLNGALKRAFARDVPFGISVDEVMRLHAVLETGVCELTGIAFEIGNGKVGPNSPSLDRIKPELGYVDGNLRVIIFALNSAMGDWGLETLIEMVKRIRH